MATFKPMLASNVELESIRYPVYATPKYDGIRCVIRGGKALSRKLLPIPNLHVQNVLSKCPNNLDGELICHGKTFNQIQSEIMREDGEPKFTFYVFDIIDTKAPYLDRIEKLEDMELPSCCKKVIPSEIQNEDELLDAEREAVEEFDFEGLMIRSGDGPYKYGRATAKQGYLSKLKRFTDAEATIIGYEELQHNTNEQTRDALGHAKRSHKKEGMVPAGTLGAFIVRDGEQTFKVATGLTAAERQEYWDKKEDMIGKLVKYKFQEAGAKDLPRFPTFLGIRHPDDL
jgi:DNA ligase-1